VLTAVDAESALNRLAADDPDTASSVCGCRSPQASHSRDACARRMANSEHPVAIVTGDYLLDAAVLGELRALNTTVYFKPLWLGELVGLREFLLRDDT